MKRTARILLGLLPVLAFSCTQYTPEDPDPKKCHAGEEWNGVKCVPRGCELNIHCDDGEFCNGRETCDADGKCRAGEAADCTGAYQCVEGFCNEEEDRCDYILNHQSCPQEHVCDPAAGCVAGTTCASDSECPQRFCFLERKCVDNVCIWESPRDCSDGFQCTRDECKEAVEECKHMARDTDCESADPCLQGRCDPTDPDADPDTGCVFVLLQGSPEICDGLDNDCDGRTDEKKHNDTEGSICACMTPCENQADCITAGECTHIDGVGSFCVAECDENGECNASYMTCVTTEWGGVVVSACVCEPDGCPQNCACVQECFVYGLTRCMGGRCTSPCTSDDYCPYPYFCDTVLGYCSCNLDPEASCLACVLSRECVLWDLGNRCYDMNRGVTYNECKIHCTETEPCPTPVDGSELYCHQSTLCACSPPEGFCGDCGETTEHVCDPYRMECTPVAFADDQPVHMCTSPCDAAYDCPQGWACQDVEGAFRCVNPYCLECYQTVCSLEATDECDPLGLECIEIRDGEWACSEYCIASEECPVGMICETGVCLCPD